MMIVCKLTQWFIRQHAEPSGAFDSTLSARHLKHCEVCRAYCHRLMQIEEQLGAASADSLTAAQHDRIQAGVLKRLREQERSSDHSISLPARPSVPLRGMAVAAAAILFLAVNVLVLRYHFPVQPAQEPVTLSSLFEDTERFGRRIPQLIHLPEQSMRGEMTKLANDAQRAVAFLVNCTPSHPGLELDNGM